MTSRIAQWTFDVTDMERMAEFWSQALGYRPEMGNDGCATLHPPASSDGYTPTVWLQAVQTPKLAAKNRAHPDLVVADADVDAEVDRLITLGARHADVGQTGEEPFVVLADPEGNEFCVLRRNRRDKQR